MRFYFIIAVIWIATGCGQPPPENKKIAAATGADTLAKDSITYTILTYFAVYELSKATTAITVNLREFKDKTIFDSIFEQVNLIDSIGYSLRREPKNSLYFDTLATYGLLKNYKLETAVKRQLAVQYFVYGTKGVATCRVKDVLFALDECITNILAFTIDYDTIKYGHPLFCSTELIKLNYGKDYSHIEKAIDKYQESQQYDYTDSIPTRIFANIDSLYFTYNDNFDWDTHPWERKCTFPTRAIYRLQKDGTFKIEWVDGLDLFGIPCD